MKCADIGADQNAPHWGRMPSLISMNVTDSASPCRSAPMKTPSLSRTSTSSRVPERCMPMTTIGLACRSRAFIGPRSSSDHPERERQARELVERVLRMISGVEVLGRENHEASRNHVDGADVLPPLVRPARPVIEPGLGDARIFPNRPDVRLVEHQRARFPEAAERPTAGALLGTGPVDDAGEGPAHVRHVAVPNGTSRALLADLLEPVDVHARVRRPRLDGVDLANDLLRGRDHAGRIAYRKAQTAIVVVDEVSPALLVLPVRRGRAADDVPRLLRMLQKAVDHDRRDRVLYRLETELQIGADLEDLVEQERLSVCDAGARSGSDRCRTLTLRIHGRSRRPIAGRRSEP